jgi:hypothetical protein
MSNMKNIIFNKRCFMMRSILRLLVPLGLALALSGCWHVPMSTLWRLRNVDMLELDPAALRLGARLPNWLDPQPGTVTVKLTTARDGEAERVEELTLVETRETAELSQLATESRPGTHLRAYRLSGVDSARLRALQAASKAAKAAEPNRKGSIKIVLDARACQHERPPAGPILIDLFLSLGDGEGYFKLLEDVDLREWEKPGEKFEATTPACGKWATRAS